jgi:4-hydroxy-4-methyl-2-oxoglutarate aldolase
MGIPHGSLVDRLEATYSGAIFDVLREMGLPDQALPSNLRPLDPKMKLAGPVFTASGSTAAISEDESVLRWCDLLSEAPAGHVVVCQPNDSTVSHMGELSAETLNFRGVRGYVVDGGCRDTSFILGLGFRVFCRYTTPGDIVGRWSVDTLGEPIRIGNLTIHSGDYIMGDMDGLVIIPKALVEECVDRVEKVISTENLVRKAILSGTDPKEAYLKYGRF